MIHVRDSGGIANIGAIKARDASNALVAMSQAYIRDESGISALLTPSSVVASPDSVTGAGYSPVDVVVTTNASSCTPPGPGSYTYAWSTVDPEWVAVSPTSQATAFRSPSLAPGAISSATFVCTVTGSGGSVESNPVFAVAYNNYAPL